MSSDYTRSVRVPFLILRLFRSYENAYTTESPTRNFMVDRPWNMSDGDESRIRFRLDRLPFEIISGRCSIVLQEIDQLPTMFAQPRLLLHVGRICKWSRFRIWLPKATAEISSEMIAKLISRNNRGGVLRVESSQSRSLSRFYLFCMHAQRG